MRCSHQVMNLTHTWRRFQRALIVSGKHSSSKLPNRMMDVGKAIQNASDLNQRTGYGGCVSDFNSVGPVDGAGFDRFQECFDCAVEILEYGYIAVQIRINRGSGSLAGPDEYRLGSRSLRGLYIPQ